MHSLLKRCIIAITEKQQNGSTTVIVIKRNKSSFLSMLGENTTETWMSVYKIAAACCVRMLCITVSVKYLTVAEGDKNEHLVGGMK